MINPVECPFCGNRGQVIDFDIDEGDGLVCQKCDKWFFFYWDELDDEDDLEVGEEPF